MVKIPIPVVKQFYFHHVCVSWLNDSQPKVFPEIHPTMSLSIYCCFLILLFPPSLISSKELLSHFTQFMPLVPLPTSPTFTVSFQMQESEPHSLPTCLNLFYTLHEKCFSSLNMRMRGRLVHLFIDMSFSWNTWSYQSNYQINFVRMDNISHSNKKQGICVLKSLSIL